MTVSSPDLLPFSKVAPACCWSQVSSDQTALVEPSFIFCGFAKFTRIVCPKSSESFCKQHFYSVRDGKYIFTVTDRLHV